MKQGKPEAVNGRRSRAHTRSLVREANSAMTESLRLARRGDTKAAARAARLAERQSKLAGQLFKLDAELKLLAAAQRHARFDKLQAASPAPPRKQPDWRTPPGAEPAEAIFARLRASAEAED